MILTTSESGCSKSDNAQSTAASLDKNRNISSDLEVEHNATEK